MDNQRSSAENLVSLLRRERLIRQVLVIAISTAMTIGFASWQRSLDNALVLGGFINKTTDNLHNLSLSTTDLVSQASVWLLKIGIHPILTSLMLSGVRTIVFVYATSLLLQFFGVEKQLTPLAASAIVVSGALNIGQSVYPLLIGSSHIHGSLSIGFSIMTLGLFLTKRMTLTIASGSVTLLLHPIWGLMTVYLVIFALASLYRQRAPLLHRYGALTTVLLAGAHTLNSLLRETGRKNEVEYSDYTSYMAYWDFHRPSYYVNFLTVVGVMAMFFICVKSVCQRTHREFVDFRIVVLITLWAVSATAYVAQPIMTRLNPQSVFVAAMPSRITLLPGVLVVSWVSAILIVVCARRRNSRERIGFPKVRQLGLTFGALLILVSLAFSIFERRSEWKSYKESTSCQGLNSIRGSWLVTSETYSVIFRKCHFQVLVDPSGIDFVPYFPYLVDELKRVIEIGYGLDFENPPLETRSQGQIRDVAFKSGWESRSGSEWEEAQQSLGFIAIAVPADWQLQLPEIPQSDPGFRAYRLTGSDQ